MTLTLSRRLINMQGRFFSLGNALIFHALLRKAGRTRTPEPPGSWWRQMSKCEIYPVPMLHLLLEEAALI